MIVTCSFAVPVWMIFYSEWRNFRIDKMYVLLYFFLAGNVNIDCNWIRPLLNWNERMYIRVVMVHLFRMEI